MGLESPDTKQSEVGLAGNIVTKVSDFNTASVTYNRRTLGGRVMQRIEELSNRENIAL